MTVTSGSVTLEKDGQNLIGISIGGGAPYCPCIYIVQIFDNTPAAKDGSLTAGDELVAVNQQTVKGKTKVEVARLIQSIKGKVAINYNKLHADPKQGKSLDIILKKVKHLVVENMSASTADALGLSRAILCNDSMVKKLEELERTALTYRGLVFHCNALFKQMHHLSQVHRGMGDVFTEVGCKDPHPSASEAFTIFGESHRQLEKHALDLFKDMRPLLQDLRTFLFQAVPDTRLTVKKYLDAKFEYLSYCLKVKELDDEEYSYTTMQEPLYRVETGNYEYRLVLRCRQDARVRFAKMRNDVLVKLELLDQKHVQDVCQRLHTFVKSMHTYCVRCYECMEKAQVFPIEVSLSQQTFNYGVNERINDGQDDEGPLQQTPSKRDDDDKLIDVMP